MAVAAMRAYYSPVKFTGDQRTTGTLIVFMCCQQFLTGHEKRHDNLYALHDSEAMKMQRHSDPSARQDTDNHSAPHFSIQHRIQVLQKELNDFNERIAELESEGHRDHAIELLKAHAIDFARQIDELRYLLVRSTTKGESRKVHP
jgi:hypothetical protein